LSSRTLWQPCPEFCDKVICMGCGGQPTFVGAPFEVLKFFSVHRLGEVFDRTEELGAECWRARFEATVSATIRICLSFELVSMAATGQGRRHDHETTVDNALTRGLVTAEPGIRRGASSV
jgi:hypothetical protein